jgi:nitrogen PTS system EIIA component
MVAVADLVTPDHVIGRLAVGDKAELLRLLGGRAAAALKRETASIIGALLARERLGSTGIGRGFALPHTSIPALPNFFGVFATLQRPIDFEAVDGQPVDLVFLLLSPDGAAKAHLAALAAITRRLREAGVADSLRRTRDPIELYSRLVGPARTASS